MPVIGFLVNEVLSVPAFLIGIITAVGLGALRRPVGVIVGGAVKAALGFLLIGAGATLVTAALEPLGALIQAATGAHGVVPTNEAIVSIAQEALGSRVAWLMIAGFAVSLVLARFTPLRYIFLTGHHVLFMATMLAIILTTAGYPVWLVVGLGAILLGILMVSLPAISQPWTRRITGDDSVAIGHFGTAGYVVAGAIGRVVGGHGRRKSTSTEEITVPEGLRFLRDSMVATSLSMVIMYVLLAVAALLRIGDAAFDAFDDGATDTGNFLMQATTQGLQFGVAVAVILFGVRTILGELVPAFQGIAEKVVPGAIPALDAPIVFPFAQNAVLVGFVSSFIGGLIGLLMLTVWLNPALGVALVLPGLVPHFFTGGAAGVYGNATGGRRGAAAGGFFNGLIITILPAFLLGVLGTFGGEDTTFGDADFGWFGIAIGSAGAVGGWLGLAIIALIGAAVLVLGLVCELRLVRGNWDPAPWRGSSTGNHGQGGGVHQPTTEPDSRSGHAAQSGNAPRDAIHRYPKIPPPVGAPAPPPTIQ